MKCLLLPLSCSSTSLISRPSYTRSVGRGTPASAEAVGKRSSDETTSAERLPGGIVPGQYANAASWIPPSHVL
eukprot:CAMPEP_0174730450 /NCGR_PEP_ID=MMETSP1094-20130205/55667_1 /TAXON_ID=156173 /ORGANISM="Chrysochromulina brevifilum, Strain UTEX LB 985" /LENGTH=72 /DNA_ID=CAMNT_0015932719 /DNA_START=40 /DNA_END=255 /DNA_ORIENTATION=+